MNLDAVPQDEQSFYGGIRKGIYARGRDGRYVMTPSKGWEVETYFTSVALHDLNLKMQRALERVKQGELSPLVIHMMAHKMDVKILSAEVGMFAWRVKRHCKGSVFKRLSPKILERYARVFRIDVEALKALPKESSYD